MGIVNFSPKQDGTGDPSPTNVRPIHPGLVLKSKNLLSHDGWTVGTTYMYIKFIDEEQICNMSFVLKDSSIDISGIYIGFALTEPTSASTLNNGYRWCIENGAIKSAKTNTVYYPTTTAGQLCTYCVIYPATQDVFDRLFSAYDIQVEFGSTATEYEPYYNMEIYGGYVDFENGELVEEWNFKHLIGSDFQSISKGRQGNAPYMPYTYRITDAKALDGSEYKNSMISDKMRPLTASGGYANIYEGYMNDAWRFLFGAPEDLSTIDVARSWVDEIGGIDIIYQLDTPITYNLTASQLTQVYNQLVPVSPVMLERRRRMIAGCNPELPPQYKRVEYIQSKNVAYIATNYIPTRYDEFDVEFMIDMYSSSFIGLFSAGTDTYQLVYLLSNTGDGYSYLRYFSTGASGVHLNLLLDTWYKLTLSANGLMSVNGISRNYSYENEVSGNNNNMYIFRRRDTNNPFIGKLKSFKVTNDGTLKLNLVPCVRISDNVAGVYDTVSKTFYSSASTAEAFTPGRTMY